MSLLGRQDKGHNSIPPFLIHKQQQSDFNALLPNCFERITSRNSSEIAKLFKKLRADENLYFLGQKIIYDQTN